MRSETALRSQLPRLGRSIANAVSTNPWIAALTIFAAAFDRR
jgi:hypothetical protein